MIGHDLITTDGTTLLGADDKAGVAIIMDLADYLYHHPEIKHNDSNCLKVEGVVSEYSSD